MYHKDSRGRVRFTYNSQRYEINKDGVLRSYARDRVFRGSERSQAVMVRGLDRRGRNMLWEAIHTARNA